MERSGQIKAQVFTVLAVAGGIACVLLPWAPRTDFDIIGVLFLMQNVIPVMVLGATIGCATLAIVYWWRFLFSR